MNLAKLSSTQISTKIMRKISFLNNEYCHIFNRGVDKRQIFLDDEDYWKFFDCVRDFNNDTEYEERLNVLGLNRHTAIGTELSSVHFRKLGDFLEKQEKIVDVPSYIFNPNHFHFILKQLRHEGISNFMHKIGTSYTNYFNKKYERSGALFQGPFKAIPIIDDEYFLWLIGYVNGNSEIHNIAAAGDYSWSSYAALCKELSSVQHQQERSNLSLLSGTEAILERFKNVEEFQVFVEKVIQESREEKRKNKRIKKYLLERLN